MKALLIYPEIQETFFNFHHALQFVSKKAALPPIGLITVSAMFPMHWEKKLIDMNVTVLSENDIEWADYIFISAMYIQKKSLLELIERCKNHEVKIVAGGPLFTHEYSKFPKIDHFILNEAEITLRSFISDLENNIIPKKIYSTVEFPELTSSPVPEYNLLSMSSYVYMNIQFSRGCPYPCEFCEIPSLLGKRVRIKTSSQILNEMEALYQSEWRGPVFIVDDNFIANKAVIKTDLLPAMQKWMQDHSYPFTFYVQTSIDLADDTELMHLMTQAGIDSTFIGIETPSELSLEHSKKKQNINRDMIKSVRRIQNSGLQVSGGFIVGFDSDTPHIFDQQIEFIQKSGIVWAMVGLLNAPKNTVLYNRLKNENRLASEATGSNTDFSMNFVPKMDKEILLAGYYRILRNIYSIKPYYLRIRVLLNNYKPKLTRHHRLEAFHLKALIKSIWKIGVINKGRYEYWKLLLWTLINRPKLLQDTIIYIITGYHFRKVYRID